jgi:ribosome-associated protein
VKDSKLLSDAEKKTILNKLNSRVSGEGNLIISDESSRSQHSNREKALNKFFSLLVRTLQKRKVRKATSPTSSSKEKRMQEKKRKKEIKQLRNSTRFD